MSILTRHTGHLTCPTWCQNHDLFTVHGDDLLETHVASVGYVVPTDIHDPLVEVRLASYRFMLKGKLDQPPMKVELRHEGHDVRLGATDARVLAEQLLAAADTLDGT